MLRRQEYSTETNNERTLKVLQPGCEEWAVLLREAQREEDSGSKNSKCKASVARTAFLNSERIKPHRKCFE